MCRNKESGAAMSKRQGLYAVGLTGGIATGKSTVSQMLVELGADLVDADKLSRKVVEPGSQGLAKVAEAFGPGIISPEGSLDRKKLGDIVFRCRRDRKILEGIIHPLVFHEIEEILTLKAQKWLESGRTGVIVLDVPLLFETGAEVFTDEVWVVWACRSTQERRLAERDGLSEKDARLRIDAQMPLEEKVRLAQRVIRNQKSLCDTERQVEVFWKALQKDLNEGNRNI